MNEENKYANFESDIKTLETIISELEKEELSLSQTMELYEKGKLLIEKCNKVLDEARLVIKEHEN
tara:strand:- start:8414 stop:8608 length:195 start_codon:yes stop_codon:yes gene_type:complete